MSVLALVFAAGDGGQLGTQLPAAFVRVGGVPLVVRAVRCMLGSGAVDRVIVAARPCELVKARSLFAADSARVGALGWPGMSGSLLFPDDVHTVVVHGATRPLTPPTLVASVVSASVACDGVVVPVLPVSDTIKRLDPVGTVLGTEDRAGLRTPQTPIALPADLLRNTRLEIPGELELPALLDQLGEPVHFVPGDPDAFELRTAWDLQLAELLVST